MLVTTPATADDTCPVGHGGLGVADARIVQDADGVITSIDTADGRVYGWPIDDLIGARAPMMVHPDDRDIVASVRNRVRASGAPKRAQIRVRTFGGRWLWVECAFRQVPPDDDGPAAFTELDLRDVSARYLRDEALRLLGDVRSLVDGADSFDDAVRGGLDRLAQWGVFDTAACWQQAGGVWERSITVAGAAAPSIEPGDDRCASLALDVADVARRRQWAWADVWPADATVGAHRRWSETRPALIPVVTADTTIAVFELAGGEAGVTVGSIDLVCEVARQLGDAIHRRQIESELDLARRRFALAFDEAPIGMALVAPDGAFLDVNASLCRLLGRTRAELLALTYPDIAHPDDFVADAAARREMFLGRRVTHQVEQRFLCADGAAIRGQLSVSLVRGERDEPLQFICRIQDLSQRR